MERGAWVDNRWVWKWDWVRTIRGRVSREFEDLMSVLQHVVLVNNCRDRWRWSLVEDGEFTVKELSKLIEEKILISDVGGQETLWNKLVPKKVNIFVWRALRGRLPVRVELDRRGLGPKSVWDKTFNWWKRGVINAFSIDEFFSSNGNDNVPIFLARIWQAVIWTTGFKLRSGKVRLADDKTLDIAGVRDVVLKTFFGTSWTLKDVRWFWKAEEAFLHNVREDKKTAEFVVAKRLSRTFREECTGLRVKDPKMLWADSVSTAYFIYCIPYVLIRLCILEEEWRGKDTSLAHLKAVAQMKCDTSFGIQRFTRLSEAEILHLWTQFMEPEHGLSSEITQSPGGNSDTSEGSENSRSFEDSRRSDEEYSKYRASFKEGGSETPQSDYQQERRHHKACGCSWLKKRRIAEKVVKMTAIRLVMSIVVAEDLHLEQLDVKTTFLRGDLDEDIYMTQPEGFQLAGKEKNLVCRQLLNVDDMLVAGSDMAEFNKPRDVHQVGDEREVEVPTDLRVN
uniref:Reverse transcriptase domain, reverse transcriptase zinc-binding domain protein n=1 Tax=Tanacetum cinerariifolium TaxID=118510 RepID=A0A6L2P5W0_TANCI|nr:reverse transcriptase domain, reverse transcriptase zinc-binding domain protein [Tanacetum cinerariifolium]